MAVRQILLVGLLCWMAGALAEVPKPVTGPKPAEVPAAQPAGAPAAGPVAVSPPQPTGETGLPIPAVKSAVNGMVDETVELILTPAQITKLRGAASKARKEEVFQYPGHQVAKPIARAMVMHPDSTANPRMIRLWAGMITSLVFTDTQGNPWFIQSASFDCTLFDDGQNCKGGTAPSADKRQSTNILKIWPQRPYTYGNIAVELEGLATPLIFMLSSGQSTENDIRVDVRVAGRNPNAKSTVVRMERMPDHDSVIQDFLDAVPPSGARSLKLSGGQGEAWVFDGALYVRTRLTLLSPAFTNHAADSAGVHVYKYAEVIPVLYASEDGKQTMLTVSGY